MAPHDHPWMAVSALFMGDTRHVRAAAAGLLVAHAALAWVCRPGGIETGHDDAQYVILSRSLAHGQYRDAFQVDAPPHRMYPPGYPAVLALWRVVAGERFDALVLLSILASLVALALTYSALERLFSPTVGLLCLTALAVNPYLVDQAGRVMSEAVYTMFSVLSLWTLARRDTASRMRLLAPGAAIAAALTRSIGVTLLLALGVHRILERRFARVAALATAAAVTVGFWIWWSARAPLSYVGRSYIADATSSAGGGAGGSLFGEVVHRVVHNVPNYLALTLPYRIPFPNIPGTVVDNVLAALLTTGGLGAGIFVFASIWRPAALYLLAYGGLLAVWPWELGRFVVPGLVIAVPAILIGNEWLAARFRPQWGRPTLFILGSVVALTGAFRTAKMVSIRAECVRGSVPASPTCLHTDQASFFAAVEYVGQHTPPNAVFVSAKPATLFYFTGRRSIPLNAAIEQDSTSFLRLLEQTNAQYVLLGSLHWAEPLRLAPLLSADCRAFSLVDSFPPRTYLFELRSVDGQAGDEAACHALADYRRATTGLNFETGDWPP